MAGGYLKRALKIMLPGLTKRYELSEKACHPAVTALGMPEHRFSTLRQWKRGCLKVWRVLAIGQIRRLGSVDCAMVLMLNQCADNCDKLRSGRTSIMETEIL